MAQNVNEALNDLLSMDGLNGDQQQEVKQMVQTDQTTTASQLLQQLSNERQQQALSLADQIDVHDSQSVLNYGAEAQAKLGDFSQQMLSNVQMQDVGEVGEVLSDLMFKLNEANPDELNEEEAGFFKKMFSRVKKSAYEMTAKYQQVGAQVDKIAVKLEREQEGLLNDNKQLEALYHKNKDFFDALNLYIAAAEVKLAELQQTTIPQARQKAEQSGDQMDAQEVNDLIQFYDRLEKRTHDLRLTRQITIQQAPQIRLIQNTNQLLAEKIQSSINTAIPLWKNQVAIALTLLRQRDAVATQRQVTDTTNALLQKNSEMLKTSTIENARENERSVVDIETLKKTQKDLVDTIQETMRIQHEGRQKRQAAEKELAQLESSLKDQILTTIQ